MKAKSMRLIAPVMVICLFVAAGIGAVTGALAQNNEVTLTGEINDTYQFVADGKIYDIAETPTGDDLVKNHISEKVKVYGTLRPGEELDVITVHSFEVVAE